MSETTLETDPQNAPPGKSTGGFPRNVVAGIAVFTLVGGIIVLALEKKDQFVRFWAMQALFLGVILIAVAIAVSITAFVFGNIPLIGGLLVFFLRLLHWVFRLGWLAVYLICVVRSFSNHEWEIPVLGKLARRRLSHAQKPA